MAWNLSCNDWEDRLRGGRSLVPDLPLDRFEADQALKFFNQLQLPDVPGKPALAEAGGDWFRDIVAALFGSLVPGSNERLIRELFILAPKKSSKTTYGAALMMTALLVNRRPRAEFLIVAPTKMIADLSFNQAVGMIQAAPELAKRFHIQEHLKQITDARSESRGGTQAQLKIKTFDTGVLTGVKPAGALLDELHEIAKDPAASRIIGQLRGGLLPNPEGFLAFITTQSDQPPSGIFRTELIKARMIRDGKAGGAMLPVLYEFPESMLASGEWRDPEQWWMVTPNRGKSVTIDRLKEDWESAQLAGEDEVCRWASQHLNIQIGLTLRSDRWVGADFWDTCVDDTLTLDTLIDRCEVIVVGVDGGGLDDLMGIAVLGREKTTRRWLLWSRAWAHAIVLARRKSEAVRFRDFERDGDLAIVSQIGQDVLEIAEIIERIDASGRLAEKAAIGVDPVGIGQVIEELAARGIGGERVVGVPQGYKLNGAIKTLERKLAENAIVHGGRPLMAYCIGNARIEPRDNAVLITKAASGTAKIDPLMALLDAVALMSKNPEAAIGRSVYEEIAERAKLQGEKPSRLSPARRDPEDERYWQELA
jgi:phage terminase large subunit-like protein